jgi:hypothetical protein
MCLILNITIPFWYLPSDNCEKCDGLKLKLEKGTNDDRNRALQVEKIYILVTQNNSTTTSDIYMT